MMTFANSANNAKIIALPIVSACQIWFFLYVQCNKNGFWSKYFNESFVFSYNEHNLTVRLC